MNLTDHDNNSFSGECPNDLFICKALKYVEVQEGVNFELSKINYQSYNCELSSLQKAMIILTFLLLLFIMKHYSNKFDEKKDLLEAMLMR